MSFLAPLFLAGMLAVAAPVVFHLIRRTTRQRIAFSSLMFLQPTAPRLTRRSRLEHWLLLLLRCLALALLTLGFARPFLRRTAPAAVSAQGARRVVLLVDLSASMRRTGLWDEARARALETLRTAGPADQVAVYTFARTLTSVVSFAEWRATPVTARAGLVAGRLAALSPGWEGTRLGSALIGAAEALAEADGEKRNDGPRQIVVISDLQAGSELGPLQAYDWPKGITVEARPLAVRAPTNAGLQLVAESPDADPTAPATVRVRVSNAAVSTREQFHVGWMRDGAAGYAGPPVDLYVPPGQSRVASVPVPAGQTGLRQIVLTGDDADFDNHAFVIPPQQERASVLYFGTETADDIHQPLFFLQRALPDNPHLMVTVKAHAPSQGLSPADARDARAFFVTEPLADGVAAQLREQMLAGKTVVFAPKSPAAAPALAALLGLPALELTEVQPTNYAMLAEIDFQHPLFAPFADPRYSDFTRIHVWKYRRLAASALPGARIVAKFDSGDPALLEVPAGAGHLIALMTGWNPDDSQLAVSSKFVPLLYAMLERDGPLSDSAAAYNVGDAIPLPVSADTAAITVHAPGGRTATLPAGTKSFAETGEPGIYQFDLGGRSVRAVVNVDANESRTAPLAEDELERYGAPGPARPPEPALAAKREALLQGEEAEGRQKLWRWFLGATLAVLLLESALAGWTARNRGAALTSGGQST